MISRDLHVLDDAALVARARAGEADAFGELVRRHHRAALRLAAVISGSTEEARDIVQDGFIAAHRAIGTYRGDGTVRSWLLRVVANHARNSVRTRVRRLHRDDRHHRLGLRDHAGLDDDVVRHAEHEAVALHLAALRADDRAVLACRYFAELTEIETADVLGVAKGTVKSRTARALARLREAMQSDIEEERP